MDGPVFMSASRQHWHLRVTGVVAPLANRLSPTLGSAPSCQNPFDNLFFRNHDVAMHRLPIPPKTWASFFCSCCCVCTRMEQQPRNQRMSSPGYTAGNSGTCLFVRPPLGKKVGAKKAGLEVPRGSPPPRVKHQINALVCIALGGFGGGETCWRG